MRTRKATPYCPHRFDDETEFFFASTLAKVHDCCAKAISAANRNRWFYTAPKFLKLVSATKKLLHLQLLPTDKDGGMVIVEKEKLVTAVTDLLSKNGWYKPVLVHDEAFF